ncbi:MAG: CdvA-like protein [Candidatus Bathyarchaeota archaeon]|nr:CdvA-like protein [Candidatus Bathyarchaeota archaeon A05DMB-3]MDH7606555.1 CdvA-like protein [Candidatus Bathyarchaeota archaeon]
MISWKRSFERLSEEHWAVLKKKQALNSLFNSGKISQSTFDLFDKEMDEALAEIEAQKKALVDKMAAKMKEVEEQIRILERLLANFEIQHVSGEVEEETYQREISLLSTGLETARQELNAIKEAMDKLTSAPKTEESATPQPTVEAENIESTDVSKLEVETVEPQTEAEPQALTENPPETQLLETKAEGENPEN